MGIRLMPGVVAAALLALAFGGAEMPRAKQEATLSVRVFSTPKTGGAGARPARRPAAPFFAAFPAATATTAAAPRAAVPETRSSPPARAGGSSTAYASLSQPDGDDVPSGIPPPHFTEAALSLPPAKGVRLWASGELFRSKQEYDSSGRDNAAYSMKGAAYSAGLSYDWSVDTVLGISADMMDATVKSRHPNDARESRLNGFLANASLDTVLFNSSLLSLKGFYGRLDSEGDGSITDAVTGDIRPWREYAHTSDIYGVSGNFSMPLLLWGHRVVVDTGVDYRRVRTDPYTHEVDMGGYSETLSGGKLSSYSLAMPTTVSVAKDFVSHWGLITARFGSGFIYEFSDSANGVRALNARSALPLETAGGFVYHPFPSSSSHRRGFYHVNLGLDFQSPGGWNMRLHYRRDFAGGYSRDNMQFALGRSF